MMRKFLLTTVISFLLIAPVFGQAKSAFLEIGGNGLGISGNFDARFNKTEKGLGYRFGIGFFPGVGDNDILSFSTILTIPVGLNYLAGKGPHYFEAGAGATYISGSVRFFDEEGKGSGIAFIPSAGYRYAGLGKGGIQGRIFVCPLIGEGASFFWGGVSIGFKF